MLEFFIFVFKILSFMLQNRPVGDWCRLLTGNKAISCYARGVWLCVLWGSPQHGWLPVTS